ncbi:hypothetical protein TruAng_003303 [Truncatella angustata]|nr:hypothetical protein TruAng_003303 [Truncatella angustata]
MECCTCHRASWSRAAARHTQRTNTVASNTVGAFAKAYKYDRVITIVSAISWNSGRGTSSVTNVTWDGATVDGCDYGVQIQSCYGTDAAGCAANPSKAILDQIYFKNFKGTTNASEQFDINNDGLRFVSTILGFLWMNEEELGFDPTVKTENGQRFIEIERNESMEPLIIDKVMNRARCIAGRATTCWKAHREGEPQTPLVVKNSWQYEERDEEGELLREANQKHVINVARYYHHETVRVGDEVDNI